LTCRKRSDYRRRISGIGGRQGNPKRATTGPPGDGGLPAIESALEAAVAAQIALGDEAPDVSPDVDVSPEQAWASLHEADLSRFEPRVAEAVRRFGLDALSAQVLWLCLAPELDDRYGRVFAFLLGSTTRRLPTPRLIASALQREGDPDAVLACLAADVPLRRLGCLRLAAGDDALRLVDRPIRVADELTAFVLGIALHDEAFDGRMLRRDPPTHPVGRAAALARIRAALAGPERAPLLVSGADAADLLALGAGCGLVLLDARAATERGLVSRAAMIATLEDRALVLDHCELLEADERAALKPVVAASEQSMLLCSATTEAAARLAALGAVTVEVPMPTLAERRAAWSALAGDADTEEAAAKFRLSTEQIARAVEIARAEARIAGRTAPSERELDAGARQASSSGLGERATRVTPGGSWDELVLPERQLALLQSISSHLRHRDRVLTDWGYERTVAGRQGLGVLFAGESGTGKTMAARVLAADLGLELFSVDLATVVSKYVGETEQNLERIFAAAEGSNAVLFFDEADALFGRRSEVSDSRDRYANIEVAYLLQRMEAHAGAVILATNLKQNIDDAFLRRLDFVVDFRFPEAADRRRIWRLVIPAETPVAADIDLDFLGDRFKLSGGSIRNCSLAAAYEAASSRQPLCMAHLVRAIAAEYEKLGRLTVEAEFGPYLAKLRDPDGEAGPEPSRAPEPAPVAERIRIGSRIEEL
jgi:hypothetical protein